MVVVDGKWANYPNLVSVSAPGKVIISGEHSILYGQTAVAGAINLRTRVIIERGLQGKTENTLNVLFPLAWNQPPILLVLTLSDSKMQWRLINGPYSSWVGGLLVILHKFEWPLKIATLNLTISSELPLASGLGSSAAFSVAMSGAWLYFLTGEMPLKRVRELAWEAESLFHGGRLSGLDPETCLLGGFVTGVMGQFTSLPPPKLNWKWAIIVTEIPKCTAQVTGAVKELRQHTPTEFDNIINRIGEITNQIIKLLQTALFDERSFTAMVALVKENHTLLADLGVSHPTMDIFNNEILQKHVDIGAKVTGAGGGGSMLLVSKLTLESHEWSKVAQKVAEIWPSGKLIYPEIGTEGLCIEKCIK